MEILRYFLALTLVISLPPLFLYWLLIRPLINFWRARGIGVTYSIILTIVVAGLIGLLSMRHYLLATDFGTNYSFVVLGVLCLVLSGTLRFAVQRHLTIKTLLGLPEIAPDRYPRKLVTEARCSLVSLRVE